MTKRKIILVGAAFLSLALLTVRSLSQTGPTDRAERLREFERVQKMTDAERQKYAEKKRAQARLELERKQKEGRKTAAKRHLEIQQKREELRERGAESRRELLSEKKVLGVTEDQWKLIKPKLEKVRDLRGRAHSTVGLLLGASSASGSPGARGPGVPTLQWMVSWKDKPPAELTEPQKIANRLMHLVDRDDTTEAQFRRTMDELRKTRREEAQIQVQSQLAEAREELRKLLTTRQEAALVLMGRWF